MYEQTLLSRRNVLRSAVAGSLLMPGILRELLAEDAARGGATDPLAPKPSHFPVKAKQVIFLFMIGPPSAAAWPTPGSGPTSLAWSA